MYLEAKETAQLYKLLTDKLGSDTTEAMFKYIDSKTVQSVEATIKTLATKDDIANLKGDIANFSIVMKDDIATVKQEIVNLSLAAKDDLFKVKEDLIKELGNFKYEVGKGFSDSIKWMFIFWMGQLGATIALVVLFLKK